MLKTKRINKKMLFSILQLFQTLPMEMALHIYMQIYTYHEPLQSLQPLFF